MSTAPQNVPPPTPLFPQPQAPLRGRKSDVVYKIIKRRILLGDVAAGAGLTEQNLARELGCSQGTVREALIKLERDGLVDRHGYRGTQVAATTLEEVTEMVRIRLLIEGSGARATAGRLDAAAHDDLLGLAEGMDRARREGDAFACSELDRAFHARLFRASSMAAMEPILLRCALHMHRFTVNRFEEYDIAGEHRELLQAVVSGDADAAENAVRGHIELVISRYSPVLHARLWPQNA